MNASRLSVCLLLLFTAVTAVHGQSLVGPVWEVEALGDTGNEWNDTTLVFLTQSPAGADFDVSGYFDWIGTNQPGLGRETFTGTLFSDLSLQLFSTGVEAIPGLGGPTFNAGTEYSATLSADGLQIIDGTWTGSGGGQVRGNWSAVRVPEPNALILATATICGLAVGRGR